MGWGVSSFLWGWRRRRRSRNWRRALYRRPSGILSLAWPAAERGERRMKLPPTPEGRNHFPHNVCYKMYSLLLCCTLPPNHGDCYCLLVARNNITCTLFHCLPGPEGKKRKTGSPSYSPRTRWVEQTEREGGEKEKAITCQSLNAIQGASSLFFSAFLDRLLTHPRTSMPRQRKHYPKKKKECGYRRLIFIT